MKYYYAMITPGRASDWGELILIDRTVAYFVGKVASYFEEEDLEPLKQKFTEDQWNFLKQEFNAEIMPDIEFVTSISKKYDSLMSDNYYLFCELDSTLQFNSVTEVIKYVDKNKIEVVGDLT